MVSISVFRVLHLYNIFHCLKYAQKTISLPAIYVNFQDLLNITHKLFIQRKIDSLNFRHFSYGLQNFNKVQFVLAHTFYLLTQTSFNLLLELSNKFSIKRK